MSTAAAVAEAAAAEAASVAAAAATGGAVQRGSIRPPVAYAAACIAPTADARCGETDLPAGVVAEERGMTTWAGRQLGRAGIHWVRSDQGDIATAATPARLPWKVVTLPGLSNSFDHKDVSHFSCKKGKY